MTVKYTGKSLSDACQKPQNPEEQLDKISRDWTPCFNFLNSSLTLSMIIKTRINYAK